MADTSHPFPTAEAALAELESEFDLLGDWEERFRYVIELGKGLTPLTDDERSDDNKVRGCASQVWLVHERTADGRLLFRGDSDAHLVRGLVAILLRLYSGRTPAEILALLLAFHRGDGWQASASFSQAGFGLSVFKAGSPFTNPFAVPVESLDLGQRLEVAALAAVCAACSALALFNLRQLFAHYSKGEVFAPAAVRRMKGFALWLVLAALAINISGRVFAAVTGAAGVNPPANVLLTVFWGVAVYVIARVLQRACEADEERREFV